MFAKVGYVRCTYISTSSNKVRKMPRTVTTHTRVPRGMAR